MQDADAVQTTRSAKLAAASVGKTQVNSRLVLVLLTHCALRYNRVNICSPQYSELCQLVCFKFIDTQARVTKQYNNV
jgi:hypothetical protein